MTAKHFIAAALAFGLAAVVFLALIKRADYLLYVAGSVGL